MCGQALAHALRCLAESRDDRTEPHDMGWQQAMWTSLRDGKAPTDALRVLDVNFLFGQFQASGHCSKYDSKSAFYSQLSNQRVLERCRLPKATRVLE